ncbi:uncharacterized protein LOC132738958 [Ruditapes philippinarum]|uniref:uncharacterized protein LOC132738958 n=1 Tax=Ruditapes philippinarum TaxID=129788 RepID=UPI00295C1ECE|nr:uncharacterized protein LOC132738958 [Ruditapes philippinarum]
MARKVPDEVQKVFDKYTINFVRRLNKVTALRMFKEEFQLDDDRSELMFEMFDKDGNDILSAWEFYLFYTTFGYNSNEYLERFEKLNGGKGTADIAGLFDFLKELKTLSGRAFEDEEVEKAIMGCAGDKDRSIDKKKFIELVCRIKLTRH